MQCHACPHSPARPALCNRASGVPSYCTGEENLSVVVAPIAGGFNLSDLGGPRQAAERFLATTVAPEGSGRTANLIDAYERCAYNKVLSNHAQLSLNGGILYVFLMSSGTPLDVQSVSSLCILLLCSGQDFNLPCQNVAPRQ